MMTKVWVHIPDEKVHVLLHVPDNKSKAEVVAEYLAKLNHDRKDAHLKIRVGKYTKPKNKRKL
jgi:molybdopterin/thiamine biosynthesis adenylyltransferase